VALALNLFYIMVRWEIPKRDGRPP
jgi:hypothetical protein